MKRRRKVLLQTFKQTHREKREGIKMSMGISKELKQKAERALPTATKRVEKKVR